MEESGAKNGRRVSRRGKKGAGRAGGGNAALLEIKELVSLLKSQKIEHFKTEKYDIKFSPLAHLPEQEKAPSSRIEDENELLYYSAGERPA